MSKEVQKAQSNELAVPTDAMDGWGNDMALDASDIIIPKILLMQLDSKLVEEGKAQNKDFVNSSTKEVMTNLSFIPFDLKKVYKISMKMGNSTEFVREEDWNKENDGRDKEWQENDQTYIAQKIWRFYGNIEGEAVPFVLDLRGMSYNTGKLLANQIFIHNKRRGLPPAGYKIIIGNEKQEYQGAIKNVFTYKVGERTTKEEMTEALEWRKTMAEFVIMQENEEDDIVPSSKEYTPVDTVDVTPEVVTKPAKATGKNTGEEAPLPKSENPAPENTDDLPW